MPTWAKWIIAGSVVSYICFGFLFSVKNHPYEPPAPVLSKLDAWYFAQQFVRAELSAPRQARFDYFADSQDYNSCVRFVDDKRCTVRGWVDAQNGFGGTVRNTFVCDLELVGFDRYRCLYLRIGNQVRRGQQSLASASP